LANPEGKKTLELGGIVVQVELHRRVRTVGEQKHTDLGQWAKRDDQLLADWYRWAKALLQKAQMAAQQRRIHAGGEEAGTGGDSGG